MLSNLDDCGKVFTIDGIFSLEVEITQLACTHWIILGIELVKALESLATLEVHITH